jgi:hypothetical protein
MALLLGRISSAQCCGDCNGDGQVTIAELVVAVNHALSGCSEGTATPTPEAGGLHQLTAGGLYISAIEKVSIYSDIITDGIATIDLCQDICSVTGNAQAPSVRLEDFGSAVFRAQLSYEGKGIATITSYAVPLPHSDPVVRSVDWRIPGGTCAEDVFRGCAGDSDCGVDGPCQHTEVAVEVELYDFTTKAQLIPTGQQCPMLGEDSQGNLIIVPGNLQPMKGDLAVTFNGTDPTEGSFSAELHFAATFEDINGCH